MSQSRRTKVFVAALISIGIGSAILKFLGNNPPPAGAFSLSEYNQLASIEKVISSNIAKTSSSWDSIEISYIKTEPIFIDKQSLRSSLIYYDVLNYHFIVWNGLIARNGQIQSTEKWQKQLSITPAQTRQSSRQPIRIGVIVNGKNIKPTEFQIKRTKALIESLSNSFDIQSESIYYPDNW